MPSESPRVVKSKHRLPPAAVPRDQVAVPIDAAADEAPEVPWLTREGLRGWVSSVALHALFLLCLAFWYFAPKVYPPRVIDGRLAGSERGVEDGLNSTGGLNTTLTIPEASMPEPGLADPVMTLLKPIEVQSLEPRLPSLIGGDRASAEGGMKNNNPGAGDGDGFGLARFGQGGETVRGVAVKVGDPQFTLIWDTDADLDLHVIEPGGKEIYWEEPNGKLGGELDVDNTKGFGPENIYWLTDDPELGDKVKGAGPPGEYKWFVVYWGGFGGIPKPTHWKVRIKHEGNLTVINGKFRALNERSKTYTLHVKPTAAIAGGVPSPR